mmetsp:Transcript_112909/g.364461  ORF Transcript_112909/g.364461 Transcript_112909/m.364461 type:complete len:448 (+) Transcript_112909:171-1514(+)
MPLCHHRPNMQPNFLCAGLAQDTCMPQQHRCAARSKTGGKLCHVPQPEADVLLILVAGQTRFPRQEVLQKHLQRVAAASFTSEAGDHPGEQEVLGEPRGKLLEIPRQMPAPFRVAPGVHSGVGHVPGPAPPEDEAVVPREEVPDEADVLEEADPALDLPSGTQPPPQIPNALPVKAEVLLCPGRGAGVLCEEIDAAQGRVTQVRPPVELHPQGGREHRQVGVCSVHVHLVLPDRLAPGPEVHLGGLQEGRLQGLVLHVLHQLDGRLPDGQLRRSHSWRVAICHGALLDRRHAQAVEDRVKHVILPRVAPVGPGKHDAQDHLQATGVFALAQQLQGLCEVGLLPLELAVVRHGPRVNIPTLEPRHLSRVIPCRPVALQVVGLADCPLKHVPEARSIASPLRHPLLEELQATAQAGRGHEVGDEADAVGSRLVLRQGCLQAPVFPQPLR